MALVTARTFTKVRPPAVAGTFYPGDAAELRASVRQYLERAKTEIGVADGPAPKAIIAPHAGYLYSGLTAAAAYNALAPARGTIRRVVLLGPCHRVAVRGLALPSAERFATPLGDIPVDRAAAKQIEALPQVSVFDDTHKDDHALEVHLPFLQVVLEKFTIVPLIVGQASSEEVAEVLEALWGGPETLILISSDLSHYLSYAEAQQSDDIARQAIERLDGLGLGDEQACGRHSIRPLLSLARQKGLAVKTVDVRNSGDTAGTKDKVVGYGSWLFTEGESAETKSTVDGAAEDRFGGQTRAMLDAHGGILLRLGADTILNHLGGQKQMRLDMKDFPEPLHGNGACFVTLNKDGKLRGCIGTIQGHRPLITDAAENAGRAAFRDQRFKPLTAAELTDHDISMHISVLSPQVPMRFTDEADLVAQLRPGLDGVVLQDQGKRGVFLPVVWDQLPEAQKFFTHLKRKAGLAEDHWSDSVQAWRYVTEGVSSDALDDAEEFWTQS
jgi:AmmeMemoRadiSam system protein B/AmmeMemoRadiSam system protein A